MTQIDQEYAGILASMRDGEQTRKQAAEKLPGFIEPGSGVKFSLHLWQYDETPYLQVSCESCRTIMRTSKLGFVWQHCGQVSRAPAELDERMKKIQIRKGLRKADNFVSRLFSSSEPAPAVLKNF